MSLDLVITLHSFGICGWGAIWWHRFAAASVQIRLSKPGIRPSSGWDLRRIWGSIDCSVATVRWLRRTRLPRDIVVSHSPAVFDLGSLRWPEWFVSIWVVIEIRILEDYVPRVQKARNVAEAAQSDIDN